MAKTIRSDALSKTRIVETAIEILDAEGEAALTFRSLAARLSTGAGALYWHIAHKEALLAAASRHIIDRMMSGLAPGGGPRDEIRAIALGLFDAIDAHPWIGAQFFREPGDSDLLEVFEGVGGRLQAMGVPAHAQFNAWSALINYILGVAGQNAANARYFKSDESRAAVLGAAAAKWASLDADAFPFLRRTAEQLAGHDDREQFLAGVDLILAGITAAHDL